MKKYTTPEKNEMKQEIKGCLINGNYQHQFVLLTDNSINSLKSNDLICVYGNVVEKIINTPSKKENIRTILRPACPITSAEKFNQAKVDYKLAMIAYLANFDINLSDNAPCNYPPALLEALANYCEKNYIL